MQPSASRLTLRPVVPSRVYSIVVSLGSSVGSCVVTFSSTLSRLQTAQTAPPRAGLASARHQPRSAHGLRRNSSTHFELTADGGEQVKLSDDRGKTVVLYFYPKDDAPGRF